MNALLRDPNDLGIDQQNHFFMAKREAQFLFSQKVSVDLDNIWALCGELNAIASEMSQTRISEGYVGVELSQKHQTAYSAVSREYKNLPDIYAEMKLDFAPT